MKLLFISVGLCISFYTCVAIADPWSETTKVKTLYPYSGGMIFMSEYSNPEISSCDGGSRFQIAKTHPNYETLVSAMVAAFMANKRVWFNIDSGQSRTCAPTINRFLVFN